MYGSIFLIIAKKKVVAVTWTKTTHINMGPYKCSGLYELVEIYSSEKLFGILTRKCLMALWTVFFSTVWKKVNQKVNLGRRPTPARPDITIL